MRAHPSVPAKVGPAVAAHPRSALRSRAVLSPAVHHVLDDTRHDHQAENYSPHRGPSESGDQIGHYRQNAQSRKEVHVLHRLLLRSVWVCLMEGVVLLLDHVHPVLVLARYVTCVHLAPDSHPPGAERQLQSLTSKTGVEGALALAIVPDDEIGHHFRVDVPVHETELFVPAAGMRQHRVHPWRCAGADVAHFVQLWVVVPVRLDDVLEVENLEEQ